MHSFQIPSDRDLCVDVQLDREYYVGVVQAVPVNVYDYYEPGTPSVVKENELKARNTRS